MPDTPRLSVVVIGRNEGERLVECIDSIHEMHFDAGALELIYVDSASADGSPTRAAERGARVIEIAPQRLCAAVARNTGWRAASAPFVLFLDGDTIVDPDFVAAALPCFDDPRVAVVGGRRRERRPESSRYIRVLELDWQRQAGASEFCGGDALIRRRALEATGGYDESLIAGEEPDLCRRIREGGKTVLRLDREITRHDLGIRSWRQYWRRAVRTGYAYAAVADRSRRSPTPLWQRESRRNRAHVATLAAAAVATPVVALAAKSAVPLIVAAVVATVVLARTAVRARRRTSHLPTLALYALHSHVQQIPIFVGQMLYARDRGVWRGIIEYKEAK